MDVLFQQGVSARKFATTKVEVFEQNIDGDLMQKYHEHAKVNRVKSGSDP